MLYKIAIMNFQNNDFKLPVLEVTHCFVVIFFYSDSNADKNMIPNIE